MNDEKNELKLPIWLAGAWVNVNRHPPICFLFQFKHTRMFIFGPERIFSSEVLKIRSCPMRRVLDLGIPLLQNQAIPRGYI